MLVDPTPSLSEAASFITPHFFVAPNSLTGSMQVAPCHARQNFVAAHAGPAKFISTRVSKESFAAHISDRRRSRRHSGGFVATDPSHVPMNSPVAKAICRVSLS